MVSRYHRLFYGSSYDRGLDILLFMWLDIKKQFPDAQLHVCYGWDLFDKVARNNPERMKWKANVVKLMNQPGIIHHGRVGKEKLAQIRKSCGIWAYPTYFQEINCLTALEAQKDGLVPVTMDLAALPETVKSGVLVEGDIHKPKVAQHFLDELTALMGYRKRWRQLSLKAQKAVKQFHWDKVALQWDEILKEPVSTPHVSVITITIREGWWNVMAHNLANQSYLVKEWIIVDDHPQNRREIADRMAVKYQLNIKYVRGNKGKHRYGLVAANNIGAKHATGELLVYLQDFTLLPKHSIEWVVDVYRHHPNALIAPVDIYYHCKEPNLKNKEDWWDGETKIVGAEAWRNIRVKNEGIRESENPYDFEMNYGVVPKKVLDGLNGFWEFFDNGFGFDNTELAYRHLQAGGEIIVDDTNICQCINLWPHIGGKSQNVVERQRHQGVPMYQWFVRQMQLDKLPLVRDEKLDKNIDIDYSVPEKMSDKDASQWVEDNYKQIVKDWGDL